MMVKICGITNQADAEIAAEAGASALGFNFYPRSPRFITPETAAKLGSGLSLLRVGVFVDELPDRVLEIAQMACLDIVQLHGNETPAPFRGHVRAWKAFRVTTDWRAEQAASYDVEAVVLDGPAPGEGIPFDWAHAQGVTQKVILAGGLDGSNVAEAIRRVKPWGVDACSRLESIPGRKDAEKVRQFIKAAQREIV